MALQAVDDTAREVRIALQSPHGEARPPVRPVAVLQHARSLLAGRGGGELAVRLSGALRHVLGTWLQRAQRRQERLRVRGRWVKADQDIARERGGLDAAHPCQRTELSLDAALLAPP